MSGGFRLPRDCPACGASVSVRPDGTLYPHNRYVEGGGPGPDQDHTMVPCEGDPAEDQRPCLDADAMTRRALRRYGPALDELRNHEE